MARPTLLSDRPPASEPVADSATPVAAPASDFGHWLTRDLRAKGAPSERPPAERPSQPHKIVITDAPEPPLGSFLLPELRKRDGERIEVQPSRSVAPEALSSTLVASRWDSVLPAPDSLVPHAVSEAPAAPLALVPQLEAEDLAVLPSRRGKKRDWRKVVVLAALLSVAGALYWVGTGSEAQRLAGAAAAAAPAMLSAPLPPPPPAEDEVLEPVAEAEPAPPVAPVASGGGVPSPERELDDSPGGRGRRAGDAVARFADLPSPTLSRLAREEQQRLRKAASARPAKKPAPPVAP